MGDSVASIVAKALAIVRALCVRFEGMRLRPYLCPAAIPTIGVGSTYYEDGRKVALTDPAISEERAYALLDNTLARVYLPAARKLCPVCVNYPELWAALADFAYNLGVARLAGSTLRRKINARDWAGARAELLKWVRGGGKVLPGLVRRREEDARLLPSA